MVGGSRLAVGTNVPADGVIEPNVTQVDLSDFSKTKELALEGERAALEASPNIKSLLTQIDEKLFPQT